MAKSYQLVTWTEKGQVRMILSLVDAFIHDEVEKLDRICDRVRYGSYHEVGDLLKVSSAYEKLALEVLALGQTESAFLLLAEAAFCCTASRGNWEDTEWGEILCKPLRGRFFAMFCACKDLVRKYPQLRYAWEESGLSGVCDRITEVDRTFFIDQCGDPADIREAQYLTEALKFGKDEVYQRRRG